MNLTPNTQKICEILRSKKKTEELFVQWKHSKCSLSGISKNHHLKQPWNTSFSDKNDACSLRIIEI